MTNDEITRSVVARFQREASLKTATKIEIPVPHDEVIKAVGKSVEGKQVKYWYQLLNGLRNSYGNRETFRYKLRNEAQVVQANKLVDQLDDKLPDPK